MATDDKIEIPLGFEINPLGLDITDEDRALAEAMGHVPDHSEIRDLLVKYFEAPVTEAHVARVIQRFEDARSNYSTSMSLRGNFESPTRWRGKAWNEEFSEGRSSSMTPCDTVLLLGNKISDHDPTFPRPKLYCPEPFIGTWEQLEPKPALSEPCLWSLSADSSLRTDSPEVPPGNCHWCIRRSRGSSHVSLLTLNAARESPWSINLMIPSETELAGWHAGPFGDKAFRLRRVQ